MAYTDISCATWDTEGDKRMADEWAEKEAGNPCQMTPELRAEFEKAMPEAERALNERFDQMMEQKNTGLVEEAREIIEKGESTFSEIAPDDKDLVEIDLDSLEPVESAPEERIAMREAGEKLGLSPARYVGTADIVRFPKESVKEIMAILNHPEMPRCFTRRQSIGQLQYVNNPDIPAILGIEGMTQITNPEAMMRKMLEMETRSETVPKEKLPEEKTLGIYIFPDKNGKVPTGKPLEETIFHEVIIHGNWPNIREYIKEHKTELDRAISVQLEKKGLPSYPLEQLSEDTERIMEAEAGKGPPLTDKERVEIGIGGKETRLMQETVAELQSYYFTDRNQLVPETQKWFGDMLGYFREH